MDIVRTFMKLKGLRSILIGLLLFNSTLNGASRIKDVASVMGLSSTPILGYGLVTGLDGSGDRSSRSSALTLQTISNMLERFGITVDINNLRSLNSAAVMVTAELPPFVNPGTRIDVSISSLGDARSLQGGTLLLSPLFTTAGTFVAYAQGPLSVGGYNFETANGEKVRKNHTQVGRIPGGGRIETNITNELVNDWKLSIVLRDPDFTSALSMANAINESFNIDLAKARNASTISVTIPEEYRKEGKLVEFVSMVEMLEIDIDQTARIVINERTGTIVVGQNVTISEVVVAHGNLSIGVSTVPVISQPNAFSQGETVVTSSSTISVTEGDNGSTAMVLSSAATVSDIASTLNLLGVSPRDMIAIFQAMKLAGALHAELIIM